ncbi:MAG: glycosyltransferase family 2 protein [Sphingobacteriales bacterium]|jgi:glycosyltransferase involved in cell wall biosynthesis|nr:glycosyltransferase family 2 protein [Sphingobacteriales bacterium]
MSRSSLSVVVITYNEAHRIGRCLESVAGVADEMVVVDSGSTDTTVEIAERCGARVVHQPFLGYIEQKNYATEQARYDWVLSLDADEVLTDGLREEIRKAVDAPSCQGYSMPRLTCFCGHWVRYGGWYPDRKLRLYDRRFGRWTGTNPHDQYKLQDGSKEARLSGDLLHYSYDSLSDHLKQIDRFSLIGATALYERGKRSSILKMLVKPLARFVRGYFLQTGFLDGLTGLVIAANSAHAVFLKYYRLYRIQHQKAA